MPKISWQPPTLSKLKAIAEANKLAPMALSDHEVDRILDFLHHLTDRRSPALPARHTEISP